MINQKAKKISVIGAGAVGAATAFSLTIKGLAKELVVVDIDKDRTEGEVLDLQHCADFTRPMNIIAGEYEDTKDSDIVVITAGAAQKPGETRIDLVNKNVAIFKSIIPQVAEYSPNAILLVVSNPVDILSYVTYKLSGFPKERVIGSGTVLDTSRLKNEISREIDVNPQDIQTYILGEHGDTEFPAWSISSIAGIPLDQYIKINNIDFNQDVKTRIEDDVKNAAYKVINKKGSTSYAIAMAISKIVESILLDKKSILPVSTLVSNYNGIDDIYLGVPSVVGINGVEGYLEVELDEDEKEKFVKSGTALKEVLEASFK